MDTQVTTKTTINAPASSVFLYLEELQRHFLWSPHLDRITPSTLKKLDKGVEYDSVSLLFGIKVIAKNRVTAFVRDKKIVIDNNTGLLHYNITYTLEAKGTQTTVTSKTKVSADSKAFAFAKPVLKTLAQRELQSDLNSLKFAVEEQLEYL